MQLEAQAMLAALLAVALSERLMTHHRLCDTWKRKGALQLAEADSNTLTRWESRCCTRDTRTGILWTQAHTNKGTLVKGSLFTACTAAPRMEQREEEESRRRSNSHRENCCIMKWQEWRLEWILGGMLVFKTQWLESRDPQAGFFPAQTYTAGAELWFSPLAQMKSHKASYNRWSDLFSQNFSVSQRICKNRAFLCCGSRVNQWTISHSWILKLDLLNQVLRTLTIFSGIRWKPCLFRLCIYTAWWALTSRNVQILAEETPFCLLTAAIILPTENSFFTSISKITLDIFTDTKRSLHRLRQQWISWGQTDS